MKIAWSGQHTRTKALPILIKALALIKKTVDLQRRPSAISHGSIATFNLQPITVDVLGIGSQTGKWKRLARRYGIDDAFTWHGWLAKDEAVNIVSSADIFVITSLKDLTSTVLLEALSRGKPVVCIDHCGFLDVVDDTCGIKIPVARPKVIIKAFADAILKLMDDDYRHRLSDGALKKAAEYKWDDKLKRLEEIYGGRGKKVLMSCYTCSPYQGSEPGMGWRFIRGVAKHNEVWAIVEEEKWRKDIEKYLNEHQDELKNVHWNFLHKPRARMLRKFWPPSYYWFYRIWQRRAYKLANRLHHEVKFDVVHQVTMAGFREPGYLWKMKDVKYVWGPFGGLGYTDLRLLPLAGFWGAIELLVRNIINYCHSHFLVRPRLAARCASSTNSLIAATLENKRFAKKFWSVESGIICEIGVDY